jgi:hypothetical protein
MSQNKSTTDSPLENITYDVITVIHEKAKVSRRSISTLRMLPRTKNWWTS